MQVNIYDSELKRIGILHTFVSMSWQECYNAVGSFVMDVRTSRDLIEILKPENFVGIDGTDTVMVIKSVEINDEDGTMIVNGFTATHILSDRVLTTSWKNTKSETIMRNAVKAGFANWDIIRLGASAGLPDMYPGTISDGTVLDYITKISEFSDIGYGLRRVDEHLEFYAYKPPLNTKVRFSTQYRNVGTVNYAVSSANYKNVAIVAGAGEGSKRVTETVYIGSNPTGKNRREMYVDARNVQPEEDETMAEYRARLHSFGEEKLLEQPFVENIEFTITGDDANLGDIVTVVLPEYDSIVQTRITSVTTTYQDNVVTRSVTVGTNTTSVGNGAGSVSGVTNATPDNEPAYFVVDGGNKTIRPQSASGADLGTAKMPWRNVYADSVTAGDFISKSKSFSIGTLYTSGFATSGGASNYFSIPLGEVVNSTSIKSLSFSIRTRNNGKYTIATYDSDGNVGRALIEYGKATKVRINSNGADAYAKISSLNLQSGRSLTCILTTYSDSGCTTQVSGGGTNNNAIGVELTGIRIEFN